VVAYVVRDRASGGSVLVAPVFSGIDDALASLIERVDLALLDGTFFSEDELQSLNLPAKPASAMGHLALGGADGTLARTAGARARRVFVHLNNTNPLLDPASDARRELERQGAAIASDGDTYDV
jgi:pyrroloquinoline quinone biosynthesis protein B